MSTIVKLLQGSPEWHEHRRTHRNASETPVVMGVSPWQTPYGLWQEKLGLVMPTVNPAMLRGIELEPTARAAYEALTGQVMQPLVLVDGQYSASLDGLTIGGDRLLEIKCPLKGRDSTLWKTMTAGRLPEHYQLQVQHQLMVSHAEVADVFAFDGSAGLLLEVAPNADIWPVVRSTWDVFADQLAKLEPPPLTAHDVRVREDSEWLAAASAYRELRTAYDDLSTRVDEAKSRLMELASHPKELGGGIAVTRFVKRGAIDYKAIPELRGVNLEVYCARSREEVRISLA